MHTFTIKEKRKICPVTLRPLISFEIITSQEYIQDSLALGKNDKQIQLIELIQEVKGSQ